MEFEQNMIGNIMFNGSRGESSDHSHIISAVSCGITTKLKREDYPTALRFLKHICGCHNFFHLSSVQIIIIPACCLLCVL